MSELIKGVNPCAAPDGRERAPAARRAPGGIARMEKGNSLDLPAFLAFNPSPVPLQVGWHF